MSPIELIHGMSRIVDREEANVTWQTLNGTVGNDNCLFKPIPGILSRSLSPSWFSQYRLEGGIIFENKNGFLFSRTQLVGESKNNENENAFLFFVFALPIGPTSSSEKKIGILIKIAKSRFHVQKAVFTWLNSISLRATHFHNLRIAQLFLEFFG